MISHRGALERAATATFWLFLFLFLSSIIFWGGGNTCFVCLSHYISRRRRGGAGCGFHNEEAIRGIAQTLDSMEHHTSAGSDGGSRLAFGVICIFRGRGSARGYSQTLGSLLSHLASLVWGFASPGSSGYVRQALIVFLNRFPPCTLTWAPGFAPSGLRWHRWSK